MLAGIQLTHILDFMIMMPLGPLLIEAFQIDTHEFGLLVAAYSLSAAVSGLFATTFIDRFERKRLLLFMFALFGISTLACGLAPDYPTLLVARGFAGIFGGVMGGLIQTTVADVIPYARRATASSIVSASFSVSTVVGVPVSLWLANHFQWRAPFILIATLTALLFLPSLRILPELRSHLSGGKGAHVFSALCAVWRDANHLRTVCYSSLIIFSGFTVIPYITLYAVNNLGISQQDIPLVYLFGGAATLFSSRLIGYWADRYGKVEVYRWVALVSILPLLAVTHVHSASLPVWLVCTTLFFVLVSGRMVPAITIITSAAQPSLRGTFMSLNATVQSLSMGVATTLAGVIIAQDATGRIVGYSVVGYIAVVANLLAVWLVTHIVLHDQSE